MKEFIEKLNSRLEELRKHYSSFGEVYFDGKATGFTDSKIIVNQLAEEYKSRIMIDEEYCWQKCSAVEHCSECNRLENGTIDYFENYDSLVEKYNNGWIPCSERLPELTEGTECFKQSKCCLTTLKWWDGDMTESVGWYNQSGVWNEDSKNCKVIAWMPLPEPYKEGSVE